MEPLLYHWKLDAALPFRIDFQHLEKQFENPRRDMHAAVHLGILLAGDLGMMREPYDFYWTAAWEIHGGLRSENGARLLLITFSPEILLNAVICDKTPVRTLLYLPFREKASLLRTAPVRKMTEKLKIDLETMRRRNASQQKIWLRIGGRWSKDPAERNWLLIDRVLLNGKLLPNGDFQKYREKKTDVYRPNEWILHNRAEYYLDAGENRGKDLLRVGGAHDEDHVLGRLLERLEQRVERRRGEHVDLVDDVDLVATHRGRVVDAGDDLLAHVVHAGAGGRVELYDVRVLAGGDELALIAGAVGQRGGALLACAPSWSCRCRAGRRKGTRGWYAPRARRA